MSIFKRHHVAAGEFEIHPRKELTLYACLGTCVGVTLCDAEAGIGGLIHLILPSPPSKDSTYNLEIYAETGFPLFVKAMLAKGARMENLEACIAGGALMGPVSDQDLSLDIGGRTAEIVKKLLHRDRIPIKYSEVGGFFSCTISLDLISFETSIIPAQATIVAAPGKFRKTTLPEIRASLDHLQPIPQVALKIMRLMDDFPYNAQAIADEIRKEQVLVARMLRLSNSALYSGNVQRDSLDKAILLLGKELIIKIIVSSAVLSFYNQSNAGYSLCKGGLYHHAVASAIIAEQIAAATGTASPRIAYISGLLHDIGMVALDQYIAPISPLFYRTLDTEEKDMLTVEKELIGVNHCEAGEELAALWGIPTPLADAIRCHHFPEEAKGDAVIPHIVYLADLILSRFHADLNIERIDTEHLESRMKRLGLSPDALSGIVGRLPKEVFSSSPDTAWTDAIPGRAETLTP